MPSIDTRKLVPGLPETVSVKRVSSRQHDTLATLLGPGQGAKGKALGVSLRLSKKGAVEAIALATEALVVQLTVESNNAQSSGRSSHLSSVLNHPQHVLVGVGMARILLLLHRQLNIRTHGVDLPIMFEGIVERGLPSPGDIACNRLGLKSRKYAINALWYRHSNDDLCLRAWLCALMVAEDVRDIPKAASMSTHGLPTSHMVCLSLHVMNAELLEAMKPTHMDNDFDGWEMYKDGKLVLHNSRFKTKVRHSKQTFVKINGGEMKAYTTDRTKGKKMTLTFNARLPTDIHSVRVVGREEATCAESARDMFIVRLLQSAATLSRSPFISLLWFPKSTIPRSVQAVQHDFETLNPSQTRVANAMVSGENLLDRIQGPPGSGKTSTIAAGLAHFQSCQQTVWVVAQSNVGVKNIARSIVKRDIDFKLFVSEEFYFEWHEHLYQGAVQSRLIRTDKFGKGFDTKRRIGDTYIMLCTLSMLSHPALDLYGVFRYRPVEILVVDEASQIDTLDFMHLFDKFNQLRKVCMFGDPQQLPPYGKEQAPKMKTIFDFPHLKSASFFLDTQYRMPIELGRFISDAMYQSKLKSQHNITGTACIRAINVRKGEEQSAGSSWKNTEEANTVVNLVRLYYQKLSGDFCVITPYDAQRALITQLLKAANLPFEIVYNVDSFQGHEAPYVIVSAVRTTKPGFLSFNNRMNVMLSRCQRGMVLVTQRAFVEGGGKHTLLGRLVQRWETAAGVDAVWADAMEVSAGQANMPGAPGRQAMRAVRR